MGLVFVTLSFFSYFWVELQLKHFSFSALLFIQGYMNTGLGKKKTAKGIVKCRIFFGCTWIIFGILIGIVYFCYN